MIKYLALLVGQGPLEHSLTTLSFLSNSPMGQDLRVYKYHI